MSITLTEHLTSLFTKDGELWLPLDLDSGMTGFLNFWPWLFRWSMHALSTSYGLVFMVYFVLLGAPGVYTVLLDVIRNRGEFVSLARAAYRLLRVYPARAFEALEHSPRALLRDLCDFPALLAESTREAVSSSGFLARGWAALQREAATYPELLAGAVGAAREQARAMWGSWEAVAAAAREAIADLAAFPTVLAAHCQPYWRELGPLRDVLQELFVGPVALHAQAPPPPEPIEEEPPRDYAALARGLTSGSESESDGGVLRRRGMVGTQRGAAPALLHHFAHRSPQLARPLAATGAQQTFRSEMVNKPRVPI